MGKNQISHVLPSQIVKPKTVFKYMPSYGVQFFENFLIRATTRIDLNDPFEFLPPINFRDFIINSTPKQFRGNISDSQLNNAFLPMVGIMSFTQHKNNILMWSYYTDNHRGLLIEFDLCNAFFKDIQKVDYLTTRSEKVINFRDDCFRKSIDWKKEGEWRIVKDLNDYEYLMKKSNPKQIFDKEKNPMFATHPPETDKMYMFKVPEDSIVSVTLGCAISPSDRFIIESIIKHNPRFRNDIKVRYAQRSNTKYQLEYNKKRSI